MVLRNIPTDTCDSLLATKDVRALSPGPGALGPALSLTVLKARSSATARRPSAGAGKS